MSAARRAELWTGVGPGYAGKPRPVLVVQDNAFLETASVTVALVTTDAISADMPALRVPLNASAMDLREDSWVMIDKLTTLPRANLTTRIGQVPARVMRDVDRAILVFLGLA